METRHLKRTIETLLESQKDDQRLRDHLEGLRMNERFSGLTWFWGPLVYTRNRVVFGPLILNHFSDWEITRTDRWRRVDWSDHLDRLEAWLDQARANRNTRLVRLLLAWKFRNKKGGLDRERWNAALIKAYQEAPSAAARAIVLDEFTTWFSLDEETALNLYRTNRTTTRFIEEHLPQTYWEDKKRAMWERLGQEALNQGDEDFYFELYRSLMPVERWCQDVLQLADVIPSAAQLNDELEKRHLKGWGLDLEETVLTLLEKRKRDLLPYLRAHMERLFGGWYNSEVEALIALAERNGWWDIHAAAIRIATDSKFFNKAVSSLLKAPFIGDSERKERLKALAGISREWNWPGLSVARVHGLDGKVARRLYLRYPDLVKGPFLAHVTPRWWRGAKELLSAAMERDDAELIDILSARYVTQTYYGYYGQNKLEELDHLAAYYQAIRDKDQELFARRAANVLTRVPAYATYSFSQLLKTNALARLMFVRSFDAYLSVPAAVQDLVEGSNIHVQKLAYRVLAQEDARAGALAAKNIDILLGTLLRPIHRSTRIPAFGALANAAKADQAAARKIHLKAREALKLPDKRYPKEELIGLIGRILWAQPGLRGDDEQPGVFRAAGGV